MSKRSHILHASPGATLTLLFALVCYIAASTRVAAHTFHTSLMRLEYNAEQKSVEITLQVFAHDLETVLTKRSGKTVRLDRTPDVDKLVLAYLQDSFALKNRAGETKKLAWVGMESEADAVLLYVETSMTEGLTGASVRDAVFFDLLEDQVNLVNARFEGKRADLAFKAGDRFKSLSVSQPADKLSSAP